MKTIIDNWEWFIGVLAPVITFFTGYKFRKADLQKSEADALSNVQAVYDTLTKQIKEDVDHLRNDLKEVKIENRDQRKSLMLLQEDNRKLHREISKLMSENSQLKERLAKLSVENEKLRERLKNQ
ncbi:hypothetical protein [Mesonia aestuariivivens]|uniref:Uncharacterized protein n=1 Tax=Mesonia aestuariivivens TaxID=2796128 RepID=A0ABS6W145_9FLAO|nr:hypothetical protein [Mesonia aestuariivivens]MBW2961262.1 hypothetical protein [Mesonia aestuariivivens]